MFKEFYRLLRRCFALAAPYGRRKLMLVLTVIFSNGLLQVVGVTSVFPFFALAADPARLRNSRLGTMLLNHLPPMSQNELLVWAGLASITMLFVANAASLAGEVIRTRYGHGLGHFLRSRLMKAMADRPYSYFLQKNSAGLMQKIVGDVMQFINGIFLPLMEALSRIVTLALLLLTVLLVQPVLALAAAVLLGGFYGSVFLLLRRRATRLGNGINRANHGTMIAVQQFLGGIKPILVQNKSDYFTGKFAGHSAAQARLYPWVPIFGNGPRYLVEPLAFGGLVAAVLLYAVNGRPLGDILPNLTVIALAAYRMLPSIQMLYSQFSQINAMYYTVGEIEAELSEMTAASAKSTVPTSNSRRVPLPFQREIRLENVTFAYPGASGPVLRHFTLAIPKNTSLGVIGPTGCGKTTLVDLLLGLHLPQSGKLSIDDRTLISADLPGWRAIIGYVPQDIFLLDGSIAENIAFGVPQGEVDRTALCQAAGAAQILKFIEEDLPAGWDTEVGERGVRLSGGQRQRIGLARALYHGPQVLILDEATSALDIATEAEVMRAIHALRGTLTMIVIAHRLSTTEGCDAICRLGVESDAERGQLIAAEAIVRP